MDVDQEIIPSGDINQVAPDFADQLPPGYRFCPTDSELIVHYLNAKIESRELPNCRIHEVNIYNHRPEELAERYRSIENNWYFLTPRDRKYANGKRLASRAVGNFGCWKTTQKHKPVHDQATGQMVGHKGTLMYFDKNMKRTMWLMHEYSTTNVPNLPSGSGDNYNKLNEWVLCKIFKNETNQANGAGGYGNTTIQEEVTEEGNRTPGRLLGKRQRASENCENNISNHYEHAEVEEANQEIGNHVQMVAQITASMGFAQITVDQGVGNYNNGGTVGETRMNTTLSSVSMQPMDTFQGSISIQLAPCPHNRTTSDASNGFEISDDALMNSSSTEPPEAAAQPLDYGGNTTPSMANFALQQNVHYEVYQQHFEMPYQDPQSQNYVQNGADHYAVVPPDASNHIPQPDVYESSPTQDTDERSLDDSDTISFDYLKGISYRLTLLEIDK